jgi:dTMP kinase
MNVNTGIMLVFDGVNGAGKSSTVERIRAHLAGLGFSVIKTREPGGTAIGEKIREILLSPESKEIADITEVMLFAAARAQHVREKIIPAIALGSIVLCDRFESSGVSFQHFARGIDLGLIKALNALALSGFEPDANFIFDLDPALGAERIYGRGEELERFELMSLDFHNKVREGFLFQAAQRPDRFTVIDASGSAQQTFESVLVGVEAAITKKGLTPKNNATSVNLCG